MIDILILAILGIFGVGVWANSTENSCWKYEATSSFEKYSSLKTRTAVLRAATNSEVLDSRSNPVEILEHEFNGCSLGSNGSTVLRFYFDDANKLIMMQAFRRYGGVSEMQLIDERKF